MDVSVITHKRQRYAVWFGGSLMASTVSVFPRLAIFTDRAFVLIKETWLSFSSPSFTVTATRKPITWNTDLQSAEDTKSLALLSRLYIITISFKKTRLIVTAFKTTLSSIYLYWVGIERFTSMRSSG
jgi:hypothetical protein